MGHKLQYLQDCPGNLADIAICAPSTHTPRIQEMHIAIGHTLCEIAENSLSET